MPARFGGTPLADGGEDTLQRLLVVDEEHAHPPSVLAVGHPVALHTLGLRGGDDLVDDVRHAGLELFRRLVLEVCDLDSHARDLLTSPYSARPMARSGSVHHDRGMWFRRLLDQLDDVTDMLKAVSRMLIQMDAKLERIVEILEEDA